MTDEEILALATRFYNAFTMELREADRNCPEDVVEDILDEPLEVIEFLLNCIYDDRNSMSAIESIVNGKEINLGEECYRVFCEEYQHAGGWLDAEFKTEYCFETNYATYTEAKQAIMDYETEYMGNLDSADGDIFPEEAKQECVRRIWSGNFEKDMYTSEEFYIKKYTKTIKANWKFVCTMKGE